MAPTIILPAMKISGNNFNTMIILNEIFDFVSISFNFRNNNLRLTIYYHRLLLKRLEERPTYEVIKLMCLMGLFGDNERLPEDNMQKRNHPNMHDAWAMHAQTPTLSQKGSNL